LAVEFEEEMPSWRAFVSNLALAGLLAGPGAILMRSAEAQEPANAAALPPPSSDPLSSDPAAPDPPAPGRYDKAIFQKPIPADQLTFLNQFAGKPSGDLVRDKQFSKLMHSVIPDCTFHYGWDMSLVAALELVLKGSTAPVQIRDARYVMIRGANGPYLAGKGFLWFDLRDGLALGGFYFHPTNGEPTPTVNIFSRQVKEDLLNLSQLPPEFAADLRRWSAESRIPLVTTRYFITGANRKIVLEHDEDYCAPSAGSSAPSADCMQANADAADKDLDAAYYLEQTNHATNSTAWMITGDDQVAWLRIRESACRVGPDPLRCRILMTHERARVVIRRIPPPHPTHR
jgi:uncharacterized protein YecT (DUF1311 family)